MDEHSNPPRLRFSWSATFTCLHYPNYRLWFYGQLISLFGTWMQSTAQGYLVFQLTHSQSYLGYVAFASGLPTWVFTMFAGVVADRWPRRSILVATQAIMMLLAFVLGALTFTGLVQPWHIIVLAFMLGVCNAFDAPTRLSFVLEMVERDDLSNAIALNSTMFNLATVMGPMAGGYAYALVGPGWCFVINGLSFVAVIAALLRMRLKPFVRLERSASVLASAREGLSYVRREPLLLGIVGLAGAAQLFGAAFIPLVPAWAVNVLHGDSTTAGLMQSARGAGALIFALGLASLGRNRQKGLLFALGSLTFPLALLLFAAVNTLPLSLAALAVVGGTVVLTFNLANALVQSLTTDALRGRVTSIYTLVIFGMGPLGGLWAGLVAERIGEPSAVAIGAALTLACAMVMHALVPRLRRLP
jgi:MFS family permease